GIINYDASALFPNAGGGGNFVTFTTFTGSGVNVAPGASLNVSGVMAGGADLIKLGGGQLELSGSLANTISNAPRIKQGTLFLNKPAGVPAISINAATVTVGDDVAGDSATLRFGSKNEFGPSTNINHIQVASNATFDL